MDSSAGGGPTRTRHAWAYVRPKSSAAFGSLTNRGGPFLLGAWTIRFASTRPAQPERAALRRARRAAARRGGITTCISIRTRNAPVPGKSDVNRLAQRGGGGLHRSEEHTSELQSLRHLV